MPDWIVALLKYLCAAAGMFILVNHYLWPKGKRYR